MRCVESVLEEMYANSTALQVAAFLSALLSLLSATMLGFLDDVFDIRWRYKIPIPIISSIPLLVVYYAGGGGTHVVVPSLLRPLLPNSSALLDLGALYYVYISLLATFCTNSINILAGINGVEVGQALVIALSLGANDLMYLDTKAGEGGSNYSVELVPAPAFHRHVHWATILEQVSGGVSSSLFHFLLTGFPPQVPLTRLCRRHILLLCRPSASLRRHPRPFQQNTPPLLPSPNLQLPPQLPAAVRTGAVPATSITAYRPEELAALSFVGCLAAWRACFFYCYAHTLDI